METYIGTKIVKARPMNRQEYNDYRGWDLPGDEDGTDEGYLVEYVDGGKGNHPDHEGYISWSPKDVFEKAYDCVGDVSGFPPHIQRVIAEKAQLDSKREKLEQFKNTLTFASLPWQEQELLNTQAHFMTLYSTVLGERIAASNKS